MICPARDVDHAISRSNDGSNIGSSNNGSRGRSRDKPPSIEEQLRGLSSEDLLFETRLAARAESRLTLKLLYHLNEIDRRRLYLERGYASLFDYCTRALGYSESAAGRRIRVARSIGRFPALVRLLAARELTLSTASLVASVLSEDNVDEILAQVRGRSYREVERVVAPYRPVVQFRDRVRAVRVPAVRPEDIDTVMLERQIARAAARGAGLSTPGAGSEPFFPESERCFPVGEQKLLVQFVAGAALMAQFEKVRDLVAHRCEDGTFGQVLGIVLGEYLERHSPEARHARRERRKARASEKAAAIAPAKAPKQDPAEPHSRRRECTGRLCARRGPLHVHRARWHALQRDPPARDRSHPPLCRRRDA